MKNTFKKIFITIFSFILFMFFIPAETHGQSGGSETPFGGMHLVTLDSSVCTCSGNSHWILDFKTNSLLKLYYVQGQSKLFSNNNIDGTWQVGTYSKDSEPCSIRVAKACVDITNDGTYGSQPGTGTSMNPAFEVKKFFSFLSARVSLW